MPARKSGADRFSDAARHARAANRFPPRPKSGEGFRWKTLLERHHAPDRLAALHQFERIVDFVERHHMRDHRVDLDLALHVPVDDFRYIGATARAAEGS